jgi:hypothetical protein
MLANLCRALQAFISPELPVEKRAKLKEWGSTPRIGKRHLIASLTSQIAVLFLATLVPIPAFVGHLSGAILSSEWRTGIAFAIGFGSNVAMSSETRLWPWWMWLWIWIAFEILMTPLAKHSSRDHDRPYIYDARCDSRHHKVRLWSRSAGAGDSTLSLQDPNPKTSQPDEQPDDQQDQTEKPSERET